ncbi:MAG: hypothetical protein IPP91_08585 [Betaproteobacteria bacterium]|nr:hypothetical protein [Betaproteobacteria bacterium]
MGRSILDEDHIHPPIRDNVASDHSDIAREVLPAVARQGVVVVSGADEMDRPGTDQGMRRVLGN